jgi:hypothetical protein
MKSVIGILMVAMIATVQTSDKFRRRYGPPISETYIVRTNLQATVAYSNTGQLCSISVFAQRSVGSPKTGSNAATYMEAQRDDKNLIEAADELVPRSERGRFLSSGLLNTDSPEIEDVYHGGYETYEYVTVFAGIHLSRHEVRITWNGRSCVKE